ncbi:hypothetical protein PR202_ga25637 [Eleusine coracana subsp. coracana]|uniref:Plant heme peroxidase family profile domain-containing protein n=1 Tax=Eleusine coracana subsp. coracana TaxID=191504 RepID=A0AAV5DBX9_ELECO|nr:hypothetical protein PR202_ga25637 [Eleusine coracana subsp. coracana]
MVVVVKCGVVCHASPYYPLQMGYYHDKCPKAEPSSRPSRRRPCERTPAMVPPCIIRMLFHDCFSTRYMFNPDAGKAQHAQQPELVRLRADRRDKGRPRGVSSADIVAFTAHDASSFLSGGKVYLNMPAGHLDADTFSNASETLKFLVPSSQTSASSSTASS